MKISTRKTEAAILVEQRRPLVIDEVGLPDSLDVGQVLVEVLFSGICGSQLGEIDGVKGEDRYLPHLLGHEGSGRVLGVGPGVSSVTMDDHVVLHWRPGVGIQSRTPTYTWRKKPLNAGFVTTFNRYAVVSENRVTAIPKDYPLDFASLFGCAVTTGTGVVENKGQLKMGQSVVVVGAGGVGLSVIQGAKLLSAHPIIGVDLFENRVQLAMKLGASNGIVNRDSSWVSQVRELVGAQGADLVVDNTGNPEVISQCLDLTQPKGKTILIGVPQQGAKTSVNTLPLHFGKVLVGTHGGDGSPNHDIPRLISLSQKKILDLTALISTRCELRYINDAIADMRSGKMSGRCLITL